VNEQRVLRGYGWRRSPGRGEFQSRLGDKVEIRVGGESGVWFFFLQQLQLHHAIHRGI